MMIPFFLFCLSFLGCDQVTQTFQAETAKQQQPPTAFDASCYNACANFKKDAGNQWAKDFYREGQQYLSKCQKQQKKQKKDLHCQAKATGMCMRACVASMQKN